MKLAVNRDTEEAVAVKIVDLSRHSSVEKNIRKEVSRSLRIVFMIVTVFSA